MYSGDDEMTLDERIECIQTNAENMDDRDLSELVAIIKDFYGDDPQGEQTESDVQYVQTHAEVVDDDTIIRLCNKVKEMGY